MTSATTGADLPLDIEPSVQDALAGGRAVVALESTIITHGMPWPDNTAMAQGVEQVVRDGGAVPATIAVMGGRLKVGLTAHEREALAREKGAMKLSRADLAYALSAGRTGGTTVAATMIAAHLAGISVFATARSGINGILFIDVSIGRNGAFAGVGLFHISNYPHALG